jgi:hypothetical protein
MTIAVQLFAESFDAVAPVASVEERGACAPLELNALGTFFFMVAVGLAVSTACKAVLDASGFYFRWSERCSLADLERPTELRLVIGRLGTVGL